MDKKAEHQSLYLGFFSYHCPATQLCSLASYSKASHIAFCVGLRHFLPLPPTLSYRPVSLSLNLLLPHQLLCVLLSSHTHTLCHKLLAERKVSASMTACTGPLLFFIAHLNKVYFSKKLVTKRFFLI